MIYKTKTVTRTVVRRVPPAIPAGAFLPATKLVTSLLTFTVPSGNIACVMDSSGARCDILHRRWKTPRKPSTCHQNWTPGIMVSGTTRPTFVCSNTTLIGESATVLRGGYDDIVGNTRCEIRSFGVNCFIGQRHGFLISPTAYVRY